VDINLNTLKREIEESLKQGGFAVFHSSPGALEGLPMVLWDAERFPDFQMFLQAAKKVEANLIVYAAREFETEDVDEALEQLEECDMERDERRETEARLREMRVYEGVTCSLELAFDHAGRMYVYEIRPDWYDEFLGIEDDLASHLPADEELGNDSLGGYFSRN